MSSLDSFFEVLEAYKKSLAWALGGSAIVPILSVLTGIAPVWPSGVILITALLNLLVVVYCFHFLNKASKTKIDKVLNRSLLLLALSAAFYFGLLQVFSIVTPTGNERIYLGCGWSEMVLEVVDQYNLDPNKGCPGSYFDVLRGAEYEPVAIWSGFSLTVVSLLFFLTWILLFSAFSAFLSAFLVYHSGQKRRRK